MNYFGSGPLKVYGQSNRYGRRRPRVISRFLDDGTRCYDTSFWIEGSKNHKKALVTLQVIQEKEREGKENNINILKVIIKGNEINIYNINNPINHYGLKERFLSVEFVDQVSGKMGDKVILIQPDGIKSKFNWNPFSKWF